MKRFALLALLLLGGCCSSWQSSDYNEWQLSVPGQLGYTKGYFERVWYRPVGKCLVHIETHRDSLGAQQWTAMISTYGWGVEMIKSDQDVVLFLTKVEQRLTQLRPYEWDWDEYQMYKDKACGRLAHEPEGAPADTMKFPGRTIPRIVIDTLPPLRELLRNQITAPETLETHPVHTMILD